jgi:heptosyltransferase-2
MTASDEKILVWLPSPMGDAILSTPALRALRKGRCDCHITFLANRTVGDILSPCAFNDAWIDSEGDNVISLGLKLRKRRFDTVILFKNSFSAGLGAFLCGASKRTGYARDGRGLFLTQKLKPLVGADGRYKPVSMIDYYLEITGALGCIADGRGTELVVDEADVLSLSGKLPAVISSDAPLVILVPGGGFGPSKFWLAERFARIADRLVETYNAMVAISVAPNKIEEAIASEICASSNNTLINLAENPLSLGELKALFADAGLVIANDTGPRHIAAALGRNTITLFGPNNPEWTRTDYENEIQISSHAPCAPCDKPTCKQPQHYCMENITVEMVWAAIEKNLGNQNR